MNYFAILVVFLPNPILVATLLFLVLLGGSSFLTAIHLCGAKGLGVSTLKYVLAMVSIWALSNLYMVVLNPQEFLSSYLCLQSIAFIVGFTLFSVLVYELIWLIKHYKISNPFKKNLVT